MQRIRQVREASNISAKELSGSINTDVSTVYHYEKDRRTPDVSQGWNIVNALNQLGANCSFCDVFPNPLEDQIVEASKSLTTG